MPWFVSDDTPLGVEGTGEVSFGAIVDDVPPVYAGAALAAGAVAPVYAGAALAAGAVVAGAVVPCAGVVAEAEAELAGGAVTVSVADAAGEAGAAGALYAAGGRLYITVGVSDVIGRLDHERG